jgi:hypothetical protein
MSWLSDYDKRKKEQEERAKNEERERQKLEREAKEARKRYKDEFHRLTPMVIELLRDVGNARFGKSWFGPKYKIGVGDGSWIVGGDWVSTSDDILGEVQHSYYGIQVSLAREDNRFFFRVGLNSPTIDTSRDALQNVLLRCMLEGKEIEKRSTEAHGTLGWGGPWHYV